MDAGSGFAALLQSRWAELGSATTIEPALASHWEETRELILAAADPELAFSTWARWIERGGESAAVRSAQAARWDGSPDFRAGFLALAGSSPALGERLLAAWEAFDPESWQSGWETRSSLGKRLAAQIGGLEDRELPDGLRRFQRVELLRVAYLDLVHHLAVDRVTQQISSLADVLIAAAYDHAVSRLAARRGVKPPRSGFVILALGKLGGGELNYSSDVDLNFVYDEGVTALEGLDGRLVRDPVEVERFFTQAAGKLVETVTAFTDEGQLYRLDARLRPEGSSGRLVWSARASADYYYSQGRAWERQALIRMRPIAGDMALASRLWAELDAFVFPPNLSPEQIAEIRGLKLQMEKLAEAHGPSGEQIKVGRGGIRDVEYIVQYLQLIRASRVPSLKKANIFQALELLDAEAILKPEETDVLRRGYRFLRKVEHRIQLAEFRQTHRLPDDPRELLRLARSLGFPTSEAFRGRLHRHAAEIRRVYRMLFEEPTAPRKESEELPVLLGLPVDLALEDGAKGLAPFGFADPREAFLRLRSLSAGREDRATLGAQRATEVFARIVPRLLRELSRQPQPDRALSNFEECVRTLGARSVFYQLLAESDRVLQLFVEISARSTLLVERLRAHPDLFDELVDALATGYTFSRESLIAECHRLRRESDDLARDLFRLKHLHLLLIAIQDLERIDNLSTTLLHIAELAEAILHALLGIAEAEAGSRLGEWPGEKPRYLVLGLGKLGGQEMNYKSDVDIVLLYEGGGKTSRGVSAQEYFERLSQLLLAEAARSDAFGPLLKVDLRLRPLGGHNSLAIAMDAWKHYFAAGQAGTWERQAFLRARPVAGDPALGAEALRFVRSELVVGGSANSSGRAAVLRDIGEMRAKLESHARPGDLKRGIGGIVDVEFLVQALQLCHGKAHPSILVSNTANGLSQLLQAGVLDPAAGSALLTSYQFLRWLENRISLVGEAGQSLSTLSPEDLDSLVQKIGYKSSGEESPASIFQSELDYHRRVNRREMERVLQSEA